MLRTTRVLAMAVASSAAALSLSAAAEATPLAYDQCEGSSYVVHLNDDLDKGTFSGNQSAAIARAQYYAANADSEIAGDARILVDAEAAVLNGSPSEATLRADPVIQAWGDVVDWHTVHCLGG